MFGSVVIFGKAKVETVGITPVQGRSLTYTGSPQSPEWIGFDDNVLEIGGTTSATNAGTYTVSFTPREGCAWSDGATTAKYVTWTIGRAVVSIPTAKGGQIYTGGELTAQWFGYDSNKMTIGGTSKATNAGNYSASFMLGANYQWPDGSISAKTVSWSIAKAAGSLSVNLTSITIDSVDVQKNIAVTREGDGAISAASSDASIASVSVSGNNVVVTGRQYGAVTITVSVAEGSNHSAPGDATCYVTVDVPRIYGVSWDGTSTTKWTRTDAAAMFLDPVPYVAGASNYGSPFDDLQPWAGMVKSERTGGTMVAIPKFWYKLEQVGNGLKIQIADKATAGFSVAPAHMDRGDGKGERDVVYIGRYHCGSSAYKSATGQAPKAHITRATAREEIHKLGIHIWQADFALRFTLWLLYLVEFADWNTQKTIGKGCGNGSAAQSMGYTDSMPYHTGTTQSNRDEYGLGTQYRNIEGMWCNVEEWCDGCYNNDSGFNIILNPNNFSDGDGGVLAGVPGTSVGSYPSAFGVKTDGSFPLFIPTETNGSGTTYSCDVWSFSASRPCVCVGGHYDQKTEYGLFCVGSSHTTDAVGHIGARLQELP